MADFHQRLNFCEWSLTRSFWHEMTVQAALVGKKNEKKAWSRSVFHFINSANRSVNIAYFVLNVTKTVF